ncbi:MAG: ABC transporter permease [Chloroflexi bacterium]|nr:ABC transporter permease [Chloroflexota bacterium]
MTAAGPALPLAASRRKTPRTIRVGRFALSLNALLIFVFLYAPILILIVFSFNNTRSLAVLTGFSTEWYTALASNDELLQAARNSLLIGLLATVGSTVIGTLTALAMDRFRFRLRTAFDANLYLPLVIPEIVMGISLLLFFNQAIFPALRVFGLRTGNGLGTITIAHIAFDIPFVYVIVRARLADFDRRLEEAAQDLGADEWRTFRRVTLPLLMPGIIGGALMAFTLSLDDYLITFFTKGVGSTTMPLYIYSLVRRGVNPQINALSSLLLLGSMGLVLLSLAAQNGGPAFARGLSIGVLAGAAATALVGLAGMLAGGNLTPGGLAARLLLLLAAALLIRQIPAWRDDLLELAPLARAGAFGLLLLGRP